MLSMLEDNQGCDDPTCRFCSHRPASPLPTNGVDCQQYPKSNTKGWGNLKFIAINPQEK
jgi:hypothetical protein